MSQNEGGGHCEGSELIGGQIRIEGAGTEVEESRRHQVDRGIWLKSMWRIYS